METSPLLLCLNLMTLALLPAVQALSEEALEILREFHVPVILLNACQAAPFPQLDINYMSAADLALQQMLSYGHTKIGCILEHNSIQGEQIVEAYTRFCYENGIRFDKKYICGARIGIESGQAGFQQLSHLGAAFNPAPFTSAVLEYPLEKAWYIFVNEIEAAALAGMPEETDIERLLPCLEEKYPSASVVLTLGSRGAILLENGKRVRQAAMTVEVQDTTGAGDTFVGYFLSGVLRGDSAAESLKLAAAAAGIAVSRMSAAPAIPFLPELEALI